MDKFSIVLAALGLIVSIIAYVKASSVSARAAMAQVEMMIEDRIGRATHMWLGSMEKIAVATVMANDAQAGAVEKAKMQAAKHEMTVVVEIYCNVLESACALYLDGKTDKIRFKKSYTDMVRSHVVSPQFKHLYNRNETRYNSTIKCLEEFNPGRE